MYGIMIDRCRHQSLVALFLGRSEKTSIFFLCLNFGVFDIIHSVQWKCFTPSELLSGLLVAPGTDYGASACPRAPTAKITKSQLGCNSRKVGSR